MIWKTMILAAAVPLAGFSLTSADRAADSCCFEGAECCVRGDACCESQVCCETDEGCCETEDAACCVDSTVMVAAVDSCNAGCCEDTAACTSGCCDGDVCAIGGACCL